MKSIIQFQYVVLTTARLTMALLLVSSFFGCESDDEGPQVWELSTEVEDSFLIVKATISNYHNNFVHVSIRKEGWDNGYTIERSPSTSEEKKHQDWSRVHYWFGKLHPNTYMEGRFDNGSGRGPKKPGSFVFKVPIKNTLTDRSNFADELGGDYEYITIGYSYADGNYRHPEFTSGKYEIEIYAWYTGSANSAHPATDGQSDVQYIHYENPIISREFVISDSIQG